SRSCRKLLEEILVLAIWGQLLQKSSCEADACRGAVRASGATAEVCWLLAKAAGAAGGGFAERELCIRRPCEAASYKAVGRPGCAGDVGRWAAMRGCGWDALGLGDAAEPGSGTPGAMLELAGRGAAEVAARLDLRWRAAMEAGGELGTVFVTFCPTYVRTERLYQFLDLQQRDFTVVQYRARFVELGRYAPQIMADESLRTQGLRPELRQALIVARVIDLDAAYQTAAALEADTLRTRAWSAEVQTQVVPTQPRQQKGSVQTTPRTTTSYVSTSAGTMEKSGSRRKFRRDRKQAEQRQQSVRSVQQPQQKQLQAPVQQRQQTGGSGGSRGRGRVTHLTRADTEAAQLVDDSLGELSSGESIELAVELPTGDFVLTSYCLEEVPVQLQDQWLSARLFALQLQDYDVILGMDWLERYGAVMDCQKKRVHLRIPGEAAFYFQGGSSSTPVPGESSHSGVGAP
ncbi:hypothetical protein Taro_028093, partial [Colocasia esculenta]|nr:hypothetical protein [Colocasia esculenta]